MNGSRPLRLRYERLPLLLSTLLVVVAVIGTLTLRQLERRLAASPGEGLASVHAVLWQFGAGAALIVLPLLGLVIWCTRRLHADWARTAESEQRLDHAAQHRRWRGGDRRRGPRDADESGG